LNSLFTVGEVAVAYIYTFTSDLRELREQDKGVYRLAETTIPPKRILLIGLV
jgi:hypothetical protein